MSDAASLKIRVQPKASKNEILGFRGDTLRVRVTAPPEGGKANKALIGMLAKSWRLPKTSISVQSGAGSRRKTLVIEGDTKMLLEKLGDWMESHHG